MTAARDELHRLVERLPEDQVSAALIEVQRLAGAAESSPWPPAWFGTITAGRADISERVDELLAEGFGRQSVIVCDTGPLVAAAITDDAHHRECVDLFASLHLAGRRILVPGPVVAEVGYLLAREGGAHAEAQFLTSLAERTFWTVELSADDYRRAAELVLTYEDLPLGTTDAIVIALCERLGLSEVATLDRRHFTVVRPQHVEALTVLPEQPALPPGKQLPPLLEYGPVQGEADPDREVAAVATLDGESAELRREVARLRAENSRLFRLLELTPRQGRPPGPAQTAIFEAAPGAVDVAFYAALFGARTDVYALRWDNARTGRSGWVPAVRGGWRKGLPATDRDYLPLTPEVLTAHLAGDVEIGLYPMLDGDRCRWLAADFDGPTAMLDALAYLKAARAADAPAALEVSRSGVGAHAWLFFTSPVPAVSARQVGTGLLG